jgi:hypothetical protein
MTLELDDVKAEKAQRDEQGELIPEEKDIEWNGKTETLRVKPFVTGMGNRLAKHEEGLQELDPKSVAAVISAMCPDLAQISAADVEALPIEKVAAIVEAITEELPDEYDVEAEGNR